MKTTIDRCRLARATLRYGAFAAIACCVTLTAATASPQHGRAHAGGGGGHAGGQVSHANREVVRSSTYRSRPAPRMTPSAPREAERTQAPRETEATMPTRDDRAAPGERGRTEAPQRIGVGTHASFDHRDGAADNRAFTQTAEGRHYDNGLDLRMGIRDNAGWQRNDFPGGSHYYPYYRNGWAAGEYD